MNKPIDFNSKEIIYPIFVILLSSLNLTNYLNNPFTLSALNSLIGITGAILFIYRYPFSTKLIYFWTVSQIIVIPKYFDTSQVFSVTYGFGITINAVALFYFGFMKVIEASILIGRNITFTEFRAESIEADFPLTGTIERRIEIGKEKNYLLVALNEPFSYDGQKISQVLTKAKDEEKTLKLGKKNQIAFFRVVKNENDLINPTLDKFPFLDWVYAK